MYLVHLLLLWANSISFNVATEHTRGSHAAANKIMDDIELLRRKQSRDSLQENLEIYYNEIPSNHLPLAISTKLQHHPEIATCN